MKVGIVSDTHGCLARWNLAYEQYLQATDLIIHAGDVLYHGPRNPLLADYNPGKLAESINRSAVPMVMVRGNCDSEVDAMVLEFPLIERYGYAVVDGLKIVVTHGHLIETEVEKLAFAKQLRADVLVTGHTHVASITKKSGIILLNPGSPSLTKRSDRRSTLAIIEDKYVNIIDIDTGEVVESLSR